MHQAVVQTARHTVVLDQDKEKQEEELPQIDEKAEEKEKVQPKAQQKEKLQRGLHRADPRTTDGASTLQRHEGRSSRGQCGAEHRSSDGNAPQRR